MAFARSLLTFPLVVASLIGYSSGQLTANPTYTYCSDYCDSYGFWEAGPSCPDYCCGNLNQRYCCKDSNLDVSDMYPDDVDYCSCPTSGCSSNDDSIPLWEALLYFLVPVAFFIILTVCYCQFGYRLSGRCNKCRKRTDNTTSDNGIADATSTESTTTLSIDANRNASQHLDEDFTYQMEPPSYETVTQDLPKYEDIVNDRPTRGYDGPFEFTESTQDISAPPAEYETVDLPSSECLVNDAPPPSYVSTTLEAT